MLLKENSVENKKKEIADHYRKIASWPLAQIGMEPPAESDAVGLIDIVLGHVSKDDLLNIDAYILAMEACIMTAKNALAYKEYSAVCMFSAAVMIAVGGHEGLNDKDLKTANDLAEQARKLLDDNRKLMEYRLSSKLVITMAINGLNQEQARSQPSEINESFGSIIGKLEALSEREGPLDILMMVTSTKGQDLSFEFKYSSEDEEQANKLANKLFCLRPDFVIQRFNNRHNCD